jgi:prepilin-type N-terminal cleavage/methylation domain-containing protein
MNTARPTGRRAAPNGFSLIEVLIVMILIGVLISWGLPGYQRAMEQSRADTAGANLRAIWSAERLYWLENHTYTTDLAVLRDLGLLDPGIVTPTIGYSYRVTSASSTAFQAVASRVGNPRWSGDLTVIQTGETGGTITASGERDITPGFQ